MNFRVFSSIAIAILSLAGAAVINYKEVEPIAQLEPTTISEKAAVKFKPQLRISDGCHSYAAVNAAGDVSSGIDPYSSWGNWSCRGVDAGSQVYGRSTWFNDVWAIMYAWYFPMDEVRHSWENVVVFIDNPAVESPKILGISASNGGGYFRYAPPDQWTLDGDSPKIEYLSEMASNGGPSNYHGLDVSARGGDFQDLVMWSQLTDAARTALETADFGEVSVPFVGNNFTANLAFAIPANIGKAT